MLSVQAEYRKSRRGNVLRVVRVGPAARRREQEHYLRDDIACCSAACAACPAGGARLDAHPASGCYLLPDEECALRQLDLLERPSAAVSDVILLQSVLERVRRRNLSAFNRLMDLVRNPNKRFVIFFDGYHKQTAVQDPRDESSAWPSLARVQRWYEEHLDGRVPVVVLAQSREAVPAELAFSPLASMEASALAETRAEPLITVEEFVESAEGGALRDFAAISSSAEGPSDALEIYPEHLSKEEIDRGLREKRIFQGSFRRHTDNWRQATVTVSGLSSGETTRVLLLSIKHMNRAIEGDRVAIEILPESEWRRPSRAFAGREETADGRKETTGGEEGDGKLPKKVESEREGVPESPLQPCGRVVGVIERKKLHYCGTIHQSDSKGGASAWCLLEPWDRKIPWIRFRTSQRPDLENKVLMVSIDGWPTDSAHPKGHYLETVGPVGDKDTETKVILIEFNTPTRPFSPAVLACLPPVDWRITPENSKGRVDLRDSHCVMSIDPPGCKDIDDALHARRLGDGLIECGVHIADVSYYVRPGTALDREAADRSTTTYLVGRRLDMLPGLLTETLCSLVPNEDRFAFSVVWVMKDDGKGTVVETRFHKSLIRSRAGLTYGEAQTILDDSGAHGEIKDSLVLLREVARILKRRRAEAGALQLASPEVRFELDSETNDPLTVKAYELKETNSLVEEFMLLANCTVAERIVGSYPHYAILRRHPAPDPKRFDDFKALLSSEGFPMNTDSNKKLSESLDLAVRPEDHYFNVLVRIMATRCMTQAEYFRAGEHTDPGEFYHYGLAAEIYTHFTSPIRRYSDVMVHRFLACSLAIDPLPEEYQEENVLNGLTQNMNQRHLMAQLAGRASVELYTRVFFKEAKVEDGVIMRCKSNGVVVMIPKHGIEGFVFLEDKKTKTSQFALSDDGLRLEHQTSPALSLRPFQSIRVKIEVEELNGARQRLRLSLAPQGAVGQSQKRPKERSVAPAAKRPRGGSAAHSPPR